MMHELIDAAWLPVFMVAVILVDALVWGGAYAIWRWWRRWKIDHRNG